MEWPRKTTQNITLSSHWHYFAHVTDSCYRAVSTFRENFLVQVSQILTIPTSNAIFRVYFKIEVSSVSCTPILLFAHTYVCLWRVALDKYMFGLRVFLYGRRRCRKIFASFSLSLPRSNASSLCGRRRRRKTLQIAALDSRVSGKFPLS